MSELNAHLAGIFAGAHFGELIRRIFELVDLAVLPGLDRILAAWAGEEPRLLSKIVARGTYRGPVVRVPRISPGEC